MEQEAEKKPKETYIELRTLRTISRINKKNGRGLPGIKKRFSSWWWWWCPCYNHHHRCGHCFCCAPAATVTTVAVIIIVIVPPLPLLLPLPP